MRKHVGGDGILFSKYFLEQVSFGVSVHTLLGSCVTPGTTGKHRRSVLLALWIILPTVKPQNLTEWFIFKERADVQSLPAWITLWRRNVQCEAQVFHHLHLHVHTRIKENRSLLNKSLKRNAIPPFKHFISVALIIPKISSLRNLLYGRWWTTWPFFPHITGCTHNLGSLSMSFKKTQLTHMLKQKHLECPVVRLITPCYSIHIWWFLLVPCALVEADQ